MIYDLQETIGGRGDVERGRVEILNVFPSQFYLVTSFLVTCICSDFEE